MFKAFLGIVEPSAHLWSVSWWKSISSHSIILLKALNVLFGGVGLKHYERTFNILDLNVFLFHLSIMIFPWLWLFFWKATSPVP